MTARRVRALAIVFLAARAAHPGSAQAVEGGADWQQTLDHVTRAAVVLRVRATRAFDTEKAAYVTATGFVVDAERGLILTNRHVVMPGPVVSEAIFLNHEEVNVRAVYRDPVHDFGFYRYDPAEVKFMKPAELELVPSHARVGTEIRVVGNDDGEKLSILSGTLARLDRTAPLYSRTGYNDFNTFYYQAASGTSPGSSGSPVVDIHGHAVALNAGGSTEAASSFYLPLGRALRALEKLRRGESIPRGTLQTVFVHRSYDELRRLGLRPESEALLRESRPDATGTLVVDEVVPGGPADGSLLEGDVLLRAGDEFAPGFDALEERLDENIGGRVQLELERGGEPVVAELRVGDLRAITPNAYLEVGGAVLHPLSYQVARNRAVPVAGLFLAASGYMFSRADVPRGVLITAVGGRPVTDLRGLEAALAAVPSGERVPVRYRTLAKPRFEAVAVVEVDRRWFPMRRCARDDESGGWTCRDSQEPPRPSALQPTSTTFPSDSRPVVRALAPSLVAVEFHVPVRVDGVLADRFRGTGLVVDAERGLVVVDRETVPIALGDVWLTFAASVGVPGEVVYLHPVHNVAVVAYDPALLGDTPVRSAELVETPLALGDPVWIVGHGLPHELVARRTQVENLEAPDLPVPVTPRFRETNLDLVHVADEVSTMGGVLADDEGRVRALWAAFTDERKDEPRYFFAGIGVAAFAEPIEALRHDRPVGWRGLDAELRPIPLADARARGLSESDARAFEAASDGRRTVLSVARLTAGTPTANALEVGDLLITINGAPATTLAQVERAAQEVQIRLEVLRAGRVFTTNLATSSLSGRGTDRCVIWSGAVLQAPHRAVAAQRGLQPDGVYVSWFWYGSPANSAGLRATYKITEVEDVPTPDLDAFLAAVSGREDRGAVRLRTVDLEGRSRVITLKLDLQFWPTRELRREGRRWERVDHGPRPTRSGS